MIGLDEIAVRFAVSYLVKNVPTIKDLVSKPDLEKQIKSCYDSARKEWKCKAVRDKYEGKESDLRDELKQYVLGKNSELDNELKELISRWALKMQNDPLCAQYLNSLKEDGLLSTAETTSQLVSEILEAMKGLAVHIPVIEDSIARQGDTLDAIRENGRETLDTVKSIATFIYGQGDSAISKANPESHSAELYDHLRDHLGDIRDSHPSFRLMTIDKALFPGGIPKLQNIEAANDADEIKSVREIVKDSWNRGKKNHLMIEGDGGIGKTVTLLSLPDQFVPHTVPAVYIQLHELKGVKEDETIADYIKEEYFPGDDELFNKFLKLSDEPWEDGPRVLLLLDGFNEIAPERRYAIGLDIKRWSRRRGVQIVTSSRYDIHSDVPVGDGFSRILLQPLGRKTIEEYLNRLNVRAPETDTHWRIIDHPLMLALYARTKKAIASLDKDDNLQEFRETNSTSDIIWNYLQREIWRFLQYPERVISCVVSAEIIAPYIAWQMQRENKFSLSEEQLENHISTAYDIVSKLDRSHFPPHVRKILPRSKSAPIDIDEIHSFIKQELFLFVERSKGSYSLMHQQFRDVLAAIHLINVSYYSDSLAEEWKMPVDFYVMSFVAELTTEKEKEADRLWEQNRSSESKSVVSTINMLELQKRTRDYDFSELNFSGLDLRNISLLPYRVPRTAKLLLPLNPNLNKGLHVSQKTFYPEGHTGIVTVLSITPDGKRCVSGSEDHTIRVWEIGSGQCLRILEGHAKGITSLSITPDSERCVSGDGNGVLRIWDIKSGQFLRTMEGHTKGITSSSISDDGKRCVSGSWDKTLRVWDLESGQCLSTLEGHTEGITSLSIDPGGKRCVSGDYDCTLRVWDLESGQCLRILEGHAGVVFHLSITPDGKRCVSGSEDTTLRVWDLETGVCLKVLEGHISWITSAIISPDGKRCVSGEGQGILRIWDIESGQCLKKLGVYREGIYILSISPDGKRCSGLDGNDTLHVWDIC